MPLTFPRLALLAGCLALAAAAPGQAQTGDPEPSPAPSPAPSIDTLRPPGLIVRPTAGEPEAPLALAKLGVSVHITGDLCVTTLDLTYSNPNDRVLAGRFVLPLPHGAQPSGFAMEVGEVLRHAAVVSREQGRVVFEAIQRKNVDPGLLEWVAGNAFRARVFPIPAKGTKRIVVTYESELGATGGNRFTVPLAYKAVVPEATLSITADGAAPKVLRTPFVGSGVLHVKDQYLGEDLVIEVALPKAAFTRTVEFDGKLYAYTAVPIEAAARQRPKPGRILVAWDVSHSSDAESQDRSRALLAAYLKELGTAEVDLVAFANAIVWRGSFSVNDGEAPSLFARLDQLDPDGGTSFGALDLADEKARPDEVLLFSDGLETIDTGAPDFGTITVTAVAASGLADHDRLRRFATAGRLVDLTAVSIEQGVKALRTERMSLLRATAKSGELRGLEPAAPAPVIGSRFTLVARVVGVEHVDLELAFGYPGEVLDVRSVEVFNPRGDADGIPPAGHPSIARLWAKRRIAGLMGDPAKNEVAVTTLGRRFGIVTPFTSMLVLESLEDHIRYRVLPPEGEWRDKYLEAVESMTQAEEQSRTERLAALRAKLAERVTWWENDVDVDAVMAAVAARRDQAKKRPRRSGGAGGEGAEAPAAAEPSDSTVAEEPMVDGEASDERMRDAIAAGRAEHEEQGSVDAPALALGSPEGAVTKEKASDGTKGGGIAIKAWTPDTPYLRALTEAGDGAYARYVALKGEYAQSPAFFLDVADFFLAKDRREVAVRVLSNVAELDLKSARLLRVLAHRYRQLGALDLAASIFAEVRRLRPEEPQSHRDLGLVLAELERFDEAIAALETVALGSWDGRFPDVEVMTLGELARVVKIAKEKTGKSAHTLPDDLLKVLDVDVRILLSWDADATDMDLWVIEPTGEKAYYGHTRTELGGWFGRDLTQGYGPEEYLLKRAPKGKFAIKVNYFGSRQQELAGPTTIQVEVIRNFGRPDEVRKAVTRRLASSKETIDIAELLVP